VTSLTVVVVAGGAPWESAVLDEIHRSSRFQLHRRCLDVAELLALSGMCDVAVVSTDMPGLDADAVLTLQRDGVRVLGIGPAERGHHLGVSAMTMPGQLESQLREPEQAAAHEPTGALLAVWGPHGAPGRSVLAASVASAWAQAGQRVTLVDADSRGGALAQMFAVLDEASGLVAACRSANHGDLSGIADQVVVVEPGLHLLTGVTRAEMWDQVREGPFQIVLRTVTQASDAVVVDLGPGLDAQTRHVLGAADQVLVVGRADPVGLARLVRSLHDLSSVRPIAVAPGGTSPPSSALRSEQGGAPSLRGTVVAINHLRSTAVWSERDVRAAVERLAGVSPDVFVPTDFKTLDTAALRGKMPAQVASGSPFVAAVSTLLERVSLAGVRAAG
jgi:MinD-like ATPase involved in chromosome partitioning or flagellar assembly